MNKRVAELTCYKGLYKAGKVLSKTGFYVPLFPDMASMPTYPKKLKILAKEFARAIRPWKADLIASPELRGVPYGVAVSLETDLPFVMIRKKPKDVQLGNLIEGDFKKGQKVVIIDDGITTANTKKENIKTLRKAGLKVVGVIVFFNTWGDGTYLKGKKISFQWVKKYKTKFKYLISWEDSIKMWIKKGLISHGLGKMILVLIKDPGQWGANPANWQKFKQLAQNNKNLVFHQSFKEI